MTLSVGYTTRAYGDATDYTRMRTLLRETYPLTVPPLNCTVGDLDWWRATTNDPQVMDKVRLWFDSPGRLIGFTWPGHGQIDIMIHPDHRLLESEILTQAEAEYAQTLAPDAPNRGFQAWSFETDMVRNALLVDRGYQRSNDYLTLHTLRLDQQPAAPVVPPGYVLRHIAGEADIEARVAVHRAAFHPSRMSVEKHRAVMASPTYRPELDLVAAASNGIFAAYTIVWFDEVNAMGIFEPVGCHPDYQRQGLASAVMREGLRRLFDLGARVAHVNSWREDSPGASLYRSLGFGVTGRIFKWEKTLEMEHS